MSESLPANENLPDFSKLAEIVKKIQEMIHPVAEIMRRFQEIMCPICLLEL